MIRAVRNNNPGNIRIGQPWQGLMAASRMTPEQRREKDYCVFADASCGFRAMAMIMRTYANRFAKEPEPVPFTINNIIAVWAPPTENDTEAYQKDVCQRTGFERDAVLTPDRTTLRALLKAISVHEVGLWAFADKDLDSGLTLASIK